MFKVPEQFRIKDGTMGSDESYGNNGAFMIMSAKTKRILNIIASDGEGWEHVSVSLNNRNPNWDEMNFVKNMFWCEDDLVVQFHPPKSVYINTHPFCLHLWRKAGTNDFCEVPNKLLVGI